MSIKKIIYRQVIRINKIRIAAKVIKQKTQEMQGKRGETHKN